MNPKRLMTAMVLAGMLLATTAPAASICVWNYDPLDTWFDSEAGQTINSAYWVEQVLESQGHAVDVFNTAFPTDISGYDAIFCLMGWYRC